jgi:hypothetical protein
MLPGPRLNPAYDEGAVFPALVTRRALVGGVWRHAWVELVMNQDGLLGASWPARSGSVDRNFAYELNNFALEPPCRVWMRVRGQVGGEIRYEFQMPGGVLPVFTSPPGDGYPPNSIGLDPIVGIIWGGGGGGGFGGGGGGPVLPWFGFCPCIAPGAASGSGSGSGGGGAVPGSFSGCYGGNVADLLHLVVFGSSGCDHTYPLHNVSPGLLWSGGVETPVMGSCDAQIQLQCSGAPGGWTFSPDGGLHNYPATSSSTYPAPFEVNFAVADNPCGCGSFGVKVLP